MIEIHLPHLLGAAASTAETSLRWQIFSGAALGASFYVLVNSYKYLVTRSFDPEYGNTYLCRLVVGFVSGVILAYVAVPFIPANSDMAQLGPGVIAMLGGFSAEAVELVLNRLVETLLSAVRGDVSEAAKAKAEADVRNAKNELSKGLVGLLQHSNDATKMSASIKGMLDKLR